MKQLIYLIAIPALFFTSCSFLATDPIDYNDLKNLPPDTGGEQKAFVLESTNSPYGFFAYTPGGYDDNDAEYPLLVFLHGKGERGNSASDPNKLDIVLRNGPPKLIKKGQWDPKYPMIVVSPQCHDNWWQPDKIHEFIGFIVKKYRVNLRRVYVTGLSMGGFGTFAYVGTYGDDSYAAACVPIAGGGSKSKADNFANIPTWAFHGDADKTVSAQKSIDMLNAINAAKPAVRAKLTIYPGVGHNSWARTYDGTGIGTGHVDFDPYDQIIYDWMFTYQKEFVTDLVQ